MRRSLYSLAFKRVIRVVSKRPIGQAGPGAAVSATSQSSSVIGTTAASLPSQPHSTSFAQQPIAPPSSPSATPPPPPLQEQEATVHTSTPTLANTPASTQEVHREHIQQHHSPSPATSNEASNAESGHVPRKKIIKKIIKKKKIIHPSASASASSTIANAPHQQQQQQELPEEQKSHTTNYSEVSQESYNQSNDNTAADDTHTQNTSVLKEHDDESEQQEQQQLQMQEQERQEQQQEEQQREEEEIEQQENHNANEPTEEKKSLPKVHYATPEDTPAEPTIIPVRNTKASSHVTGSANSEVKKAAKKSRIRISTGQDLYDELRAPSGSLNQSYHSHTTHKSETRNDSNSSSSSSSSTKSSHNKNTSSSSSSTRVGGNATSSSSSGGGGKKTPMVKGFRVDEVLSICGPGDAVFARRLPSGGCQFFAWPGTPLSIASSAIVSMPDTIRTVHAVFGRPKVPIDIVMDVDCPVPQEEWSMSRIRPYQQKILDDTLSVVQEELDKIGVEIETQVVLQSPNLKKASFHIHTKLRDVAFEDYESLHGFLARFRSRIPYVDLQIYRTHGMLRMFSCMKENRTSAMVVFDDPKWNIGFANGQVSDEAAALHSVCVREPGTFSRLLKFDPPRLAPYGMHLAGDDSNTGNGFANNFNNDNNINGENDGFRPIPVLLPRTEKEAIENASMWLRSATEAEVTEWRSWIALGLCAYRIAHHFKDATTLPRPAMEVMLEAWVEASRHCPQKFKHGDCETRWASFDITKMKYDSNWWGAYQHLGRLTIPAQHAIEEENKREAERMTRYKHYKPTN